MDGFELFLCERLSNDLNHLGGSEFASACRGFPKGRTRDQAVEVSVVAHVQRHSDDLASGKARLREVVVARFLECLAAENLEGLEQALGKMNLQLLLVRCRFVSRLDNGLEKIAVALAVHCGKKRRNASVRHSDLV